MLEPGTEAPTFTLQNQHGEERSLPESGTVVVYFYPRADTPGCTTEACSFRDRWSEYEDRGVAVFGVSDDPVPDLGVVGVAEGRGVLFCDDRVIGKCLQEGAADEGLTAEVRHGDGGSVLFFEHLAHVVADRLTEVGGGLNGVEGDSTLAFIGCGHSNRGVGRKNLEQV